MGLGAAPTFPRSLEGEGLVEGHLIQTPAPIPQLLMQNVGRYCADVTADRLERGYRVGRGSPNTSPFRGQFWVVVGMSLTRQIQEPWLREATSRAPWEWGAVVDLGHAGHLPSLKLLF